MPLAFLAVLLPTLFWDRPVDTADTLRKAGIERLYVPAGQEPAWRKQGFAASPFDRAHAVQAVAPTVEYRMDVASATRVPWLDANGWRFDREPARAFFYDAPAGSAALAAAEAFAYGADAAIRAAPEDLAQFASMLHFLGEIDQPRLPVRANIGVLDDGSDTLAEVLNLMARHNLLFHVVPAADLKYDLNIRQVPANADPYEFAMQIRRQLTDEKRLLRIYGSNLVLARLTGDAAQARLHLLNYGKGTVKGLRVRVLGSYPQGKLSAYEHPHAAPEDYTVQDGATEFTIQEMGTYAVVDLRR
ncbi:MAG: hypothetical protein ABSG56_14890 [Bryobacteraceae bacterium]|jgi:hypothetical protein